MADPSGKNNQPRRGGSDKDEKPKKTPKSGELKLRRLFERRRLQHQQEQRQRRASRSRRQAPPPPPSLLPPPPPPLPPPPPPPTLRLLAGRALRMAREFLQEAGRAALALAPGNRILFVADKALCCALQALRWAVPPHLTKPHAEGVELPPSPFGLKLGEPVNSILMKIEDTLSMARTFLDLEHPGNKEMADQMSVYRRELEGLKPARPHTDRSVQGPTAPRTQSTVQFQTSTVGPTSSRAAGPAPAEAPGPSSSGVQRASVTPAPQESSSSSSSSTSASTGSITEEVVGQYYSPPRFSQGWTKREETGEENTEKPEQDDERKDSEAQESDEQSASVAEEAATVFALAPTPHPAGQGDGEPGAAAGAGGAQGQRRPSRIPKRFFFGLLGLKMS